MGTPGPPRRVRLLGGDIDLITPADVLRRVHIAAAGGAPLLIGNHNAHSLFLIRRSAPLRAFDLTQIDSTP